MRGVENRSQMPNSFTPSPRPTPAPAVISGKTGYILAQLSGEEEKMLVID